MAPHAASLVLGLQRFTDGLHTILGFQPWFYPQFVCNPTANRCNTGKTLNDVTGLPELGGRHLPQDAAERLQGRSVAPALAAHQVERLSIAARRPAARPGCPRHIPRAPTAATRLADFQGLAVASPRRSHEASLSGS